MANDIEKAFDSLPGWVIPVTVGGVVLVALFSKKSSGGGGGYTTAIYGPLPTDAGIISLAQSEVAAKQNVITTALNAFISRDISAGADDRDVHLATIGASVENSRTQAAEAVALHQSDNDTRSTIYQAHTASQIVDSQGATAKYLARKQAQSSIWGSVLNFGSGIAHLFG